MTGAGEDFFSSLPSPDNGSIGTDTPIVVPDLKERQQRFRGYNRERIRRLREGLPAGSRIVFDLLPLLVHQAIEGAPGGSTREHRACGIINFEPNPRMQAALQTCFPQASWRPGAMLSRPAVRSLLAVGSMGTVAQTCRSDLDLWVVIDDRLEETEEESILKERLKKIGQWAAAQELEVHFFPISTTQVRLREFGRLQSEGCGSALKSLLMEEFYRTHILLQGQAPLWWLAQPFAGREEYEKTAALVFKHPALRNDDYIDLGPVTAIPSGELLGACMWQMLKSLHRPFKSLLKMTLVARHLEFNDPALLCEKLKQRVLAREKLEPRDTDPYFILVDTLVTEYDQAQDPDTADLLRQCFYLQLLATRRSKSPDTGSRARLARLAERWGFTAGEQMYLERFERWTFDEIVRMGRRIETYMDGILDRLHARLGEGLLPTIRQDDLALLERKIRTSRGRDPRQVRLLATAYYPGKLVQPSLLLSKQEDGWSVIGPENEEPLLTRTADLGAALAGTVVNGLFGTQTLIRVAGDGESIPAGVDIRRRLVRMAGAFSKVRPENAPVEAFRSEPGPVRVFGEVSCLSPPAAGGESNRYLSERWDLLEYGEERRCLVDGITTWTSTTWDTVIREHFESQMGVVQILLRLLNLRRRFGRFSTRFLPAAGSGIRGRGAKRMSMLYRAACRALLGKSTNGPGDLERLFVLGIGGKTCVITGRADKYVARGFLDDEQALRALAFTRSKHRLVSVDPGCVRHAHLREALRRTPEGQEGVFLFDGVPGAGLVVVGGNRSVFWDAEDQPEGAWLLQGRREEVVALQRDEEGRWTEFPAPGVPDLRPNVIVEGQLDDKSKLRFKLEGIQDRRASSIEQAAAWLLSRWRPGREQTPRLILGDVRLAGKPPRLITNLYFRRRLHDALGKACALAIQRTNARRNSARP